MTYSQEPHMKSIACTLLALLCLFGLIFLSSCDEDPEPFREIPQDTFWEIATPSSQQMDEDALKELEATVSKLENVYSFLIIRNAKIVHEQYHNGAKSNTLLHTRSVTKRITATLVGIGIDQGHIDNTD